MPIAQSYLVVCVKHFLIVFHSLAGKPHSAIPFRERKAFNLILFFFSALFMSLVKESSLALALSSK